MGNTIGAKVENAYTQVFTNLGIQGLGIYQGLDNQDKDAPCVIVSAGDVRDEAPHLSLWHVTLDITVKTMAADSDKDISDYLVEQIFETATDDNIKTALSAAVPSLVVLDIIFVSSSDDTQGDAWTQSLQLEVVCVHNP